MKFTIDIDLGDYYDDECDNGAIAFLSDIKDRIATQIIEQSEYANGTEGYSEQINAIIKDIENDIKDKVIKEIDVKVVTSEVTNRVIESLIAKVERTRTYKEIVKELCDGTESETAKQFRSVIKEEIRKVIRV